MARFCNLLSLLRNCYIVGRNNLVMAVALRTFEPVGYARHPETSAKHTRRGPAMTHISLTYKIATLILTIIWLSISTTQLHRVALGQEPAAKPQDAAESGEKKPETPPSKPDSPIAKSMKKAAKKAPPKKEPKSAKVVELPPPIPIDVSLFRPDFLGGWTHSAEPPSGWSMAEGRLTGKKGATKLTSGYSFKDFELHFRWTAEEQAKVVVELPQLPNGPVLSIVFDHSSNCGRIRENGKELAPGGSIAKSDVLFDTTIRREGSQLTVTVAGQEVSKTKVPAKRRFGLRLGAMDGQVGIEDMRLREPLGESIFNGIDLTGWWCPGKAGAWQAINGELVLAERGGNYLRTEEAFGNFTLSFEFKMQKGCNSGLGIRTPRNGWPSGDGMELQMIDHPNVDKGGMMSIYRNVLPLAVAHKSEEWNQLVVKAEGRMISAWMNGDLVQQANTGWEPELKHRHLSGWIGFQDHGKRIQIRHLRLSEAPKGLGLDAWYAPRPEPAVRFVLGRLLNAERLSRDDGSRGTVVVARVEEKGEHVLADLTGPGALVGVASDSWSGSLALYFDGEKEPCLRCKAADLEHHVPRVPGDRGKSPLLTCVAFKQSLKIVLLDGDPGTYRFDIVQLPNEIAIETFSKANATIPKSLEAILDYRFHKHRHGVVRQHDPYLRITSEQKELARAESVQVAATDGAGLVQWVQIHCAKQQLKTDDLWIEVSIDGEEEPTISAPVRYYFSGAAIAGRYGNYVLTERGGAINRLAMPFGNGIRMSLRNHGAEPVAGVALTASIQQAADENEKTDFTNRLRLRGTFAPAAADQSNRTLFERKGSGRLVALVCDAGEGTLADVAVDSLQVDGQPADGWQSMPLSDLLGCPNPEEDLLGASNGRKDSLGWRYFVLAPIDFEREIVASVPEGNNVGGRLALFYMCPR